MQRSRAAPQSHKIDDPCSEQFNWRAGEKAPTDERQQEAMQEPNAAINTPDARASGIKPSARIKNIVPCAYARE